MGQKLLDRKVTIHMYPRYLYNEPKNSTEAPKTFPAEMTVRDAILAGYLSDPVVAVQIFEALDA